MNDNSIELEILEASYWEHFKQAKDLAMLLPLGHPKRKMVEDETNNLAQKIRDLKANKD